MHVLSAPAAIDDDPLQRSLTRRFVRQSILRTLFFMGPMGFMSIYNVAKNPSGELHFIGWVTLFAWCVLMPVTLIVHLRRRLAELRLRGPQLTAELISHTVQRQFVAPLDPFTTFHACAEKLSSIVVGNALHYDRPAAFRQEPFSGEVTVGKLWPFWIDGAIRVTVGTGPDNCTLVIVRSRPGLRRFMVADGKALADVETVCALLRESLQQQRDARDAAAREQALERAALQARLNALQAQVEPHFLFNTLANLKYLIRTDGQRAQDMIDHLVGYLHAALPDLRSASSTVAREVELAEHYLRIMQIRMGERLDYRCEIAPDALELPMPPAMLISLVENAIKHGLERATRPGRIVIDCRRAGKHLVISVSDDGAGLADQAGQGLGLANIDERLKLLYGGGATLTVEPASPCGVQARLAIPLTANGGA